MSSFLQKKAHRSAVKAHPDPSLGLWPALAVKSDAEAAEAAGGLGEGLEAPSKLRRWAAWLSQLTFGFRADSLRNIEFCLSLCVSVCLCVSLCVSVCLCVSLRVPVCFCLSHALDTFSVCAV